MQASNPIPNISYAQHFEDVRLWKALANEANACFVDIGAAHPTDFSVTRLFYDRGFRGINVEPGQYFALLEEQRPNDVNIEAAIARNDGFAEFFTPAGYPDLATLDGELARGARVNAPVQSRKVRTMDLASLLNEHVNGRTIAFLKVDVEGEEANVLASNDWERFRPLVVVVEAIHPVTYEQNHQEWEPALIAEGYVFAHFDGINRFYARSDRSDLVAGLQAPVSPVDGFVPWQVVQAQQVRSAIGREANDGQLSAEDVAYRERELTRVVVDLDRRAKAELVLLQATEAERDRLRVESENARLELGEVRRRLTALESSLPFRAARTPVRVARGVRRRLKGMPAQSAGTSTDLNAGTLRSLYAEFTGPGRPFQTIHSASTTLPEFGNDAPPALALWQSLRSSRTNGPQLLSEREWDAVAAAAQAGGPYSEFVTPLVALKDAGATATVQRSIFVIDARAVQIPVACGMRTHARAVLCEVLRAVPDHVRVEVIVDPLRPPLDALEFPRVDSVFDITRSAQVGAFLSLAPLLTPLTTEEVSMLRSPDVRSSAIWLDAISGLYPHCWLRDQPQFMSYQYDMESMSLYNQLLALSSTSAVEADPVRNPASTVVVTGSSDASVGAVINAERPRSLKCDEYVLVIGNALWHKNVVAGVIGAMATVRSSDCGVVVAANLSPEQERELTHVAGRLGFSLERFQVLRETSTGEHAWMMQHAQAIVVPSFHEGLSLPVVEALAVGTPVVLSDIPAHRELLGAGPWWFAPEDPTAILGALSWALADRSGALEAERAAQQPVPDFANAIRLATEQLTSGLAPRHRGPSIVGPVTPRATMSLNKICEVEDFQTPRVRAVLRDVFRHEIVRFGNDFPTGREYRKYWEVAMAVLAFKETGLLDGTRTFLGIGAGNEPTVFYLTRYAKEVIATDLYMNDEWEESANTSMLTDPGVHWPFLWEPSRLRVADMNALALDLPDASVDGVFSSSSIEHFGDRDAVAQSLDEAYRVLKPGGVLSISTEWRIEGERPGIPGALLFDPDDIRDIFVGSRDWNLVEPFDGNVSDLTMATRSTFMQVATDQQRQIDQLGGLWTYHVEYAQYPHIVLQLGAHTWTSFHVALQKPL